MQHLDRLSALRKLRSVASMTHFQTGHILRSCWQICVNCSFIVMAKSLALALKVWSCRPFRPTPSLVSGLYESFSLLCC